MDKNMADDIVGSFLNDTIYIFNIKNFNIQSVSCNMDQLKESH